MIYIFDLLQSCVKISLDPVVFCYFAAGNEAHQTNKSMKEALKKVWNMFKVNKGTRTNDIIYVMLVSLLLTLNKFTPFSSVPFVDFEQIDLWWERFLFKVSNKRLDQCNECRTWLLSGVIIVNFEQIYYKNSA